MHADDSSYCLMVITTSEECFTDPAPEQTLTVRRGNVNRYLTKRYPETCIQFLDEHHDDTVRSEWYRREMYPERRK